MTKAGFVHFSSAIEALPGGDGLDFGSKLGLRRKRTKTRGRVRVASGSFGSSGHSGFT
jgi:hypothetical protein